MTAGEKSLELHKKGFNCAQCVLGTSSVLCGLDEETAFAISTGFGGGMRCGEICGAVSGGVMAISHAFTKNAPVNDPDAKMKATNLCKQYIATVRERYGAVVCRELKAPERMIPCDRIISECSDLVAEIIENNK